jgi:hypothetical protein
MALLLLTLGVGCGGAPSVVEAPEDLGPPMVEPLRVGGTTEVDVTAGQVRRLVAEVPRGRFSLRLRAHPALRARVTLHDDDGRELGVASLRRGKARLGPMRVRAGSVYVLVEVESGGWLDLDARLKKRRRQRVVALR